ncbi:metallophosphoesterase family protein [Mesorhizobium australicum]|uniref:Calcineurin-like phosphoesterase domain-containing protein n=1 Tax=Mesorhizobium australicum TaxID=536018 RepID=A0A1X7PXW8_9HYPH|nr:metallophosphoesterase [Mesorhizobium australicum]SMH56480.1 hypothetical protein SAMN02982922_5551 [Mesorhizobium australicum]
MTPRIPAICPRGQGHQFVIYGDSCSGVPNALHEQTFASVNAVVRRLDPAPEFILFPGDEVIGLVSDEAALRDQWRHWLEVEMGWLDRTQIPMWHTTGNHTAYDEMSEAVFRDVLGLPDNGPVDQLGLSYFVRRGDLLMVFVNTLWSGSGGEGYVETQWLERTLQENADVRHKLVVGHHPVFPVNGFSGPYQREIGPEDGPKFWDILVREKVLAYVCSHILAFDVQIHRGVLQICTAGAGTAHRMPEGVEYLHCVQAAIDDQGLRLNVLDTEGAIREKFEWPPTEQESEWKTLPRGEMEAPIQGCLAMGRRIELRVTGQPSSCGTARPQTFFSAFAPGSIEQIWLGLRGSQQTLTAIVHGSPGRSPSYWIGPNLAEVSAFDLNVMFNPEMGPGGILWKHHAASDWSSLQSATTSEINKVIWPSRWTVGHGRRGITDRPSSLHRLDCQFATD